MADQGLPAGLLVGKVAVPDRVPDYLDRVAVLERARPTTRRLTVLRAPGGFGKTTVLAECCRKLVERGVPTAWLSLDEQDDGALLDSYLAFAFERAGLDIANPPRSESDPDSAPRPRTELVMRAVQAHDGPCVLVLDEVERVTDPAAVQLIDYLLRRGPPNFHVAVACRDLPKGLDAGSLVLAGRGVVMVADELRFSKPDIGAFFDFGLSHPDLSVRASESAGWPIALRIYRHELGRSEGEGAASPTDGSVDHVVDNWVESRLLRGLLPSDRMLLLDAGLFEWLDAEVLDEVLGSSGAMHRLTAMPAVEGLLQRVPSQPPGLRLHPLLRGHCSRSLRLAEPERFRTLHRQISAVLARRGLTVVAMHHAKEVGDTCLAGRVLEEAGGVRLLYREGFPRLQAADRLLTVEVVAARPRLALMRCALMAMDGRLDEARRMYAEVAALDDGAERDLHADRVLVSGILARYGCERVDSVPMRESVESQRRLADTESLDPMMRAVFHAGVSVFDNLRADFAAVSERTARAREYLGQGEPGLSMLLKMQLGTVAMAQGRVADAVRCYRDVQRFARGSWQGDTATGAMVDVLMRELALERNRAALTQEAEQVPRLLQRNGAPFVPYAAAGGTAVELTLRRVGAQAALDVLEEMRDHAERRELPALQRYLAALRVSLLADGGAVGDAELTWRHGDLPRAAEGCLDLTHQSWREMEALSCARVRLHVARGEFGPGRELVHGIAQVAAARGLRRTVMRALALATTLEHRADAPRAATGHMTAFLGEYAQADYAGSMVREREAALAALALLLETAREPHLRAAADALFQELETPAAARGLPQLTERQVEVLRRLRDQRDKEIARALGISEAGVRYHVGRVFEVLGVRGRRDAVLRAQELGVLEPDGD